jgi:hypothetical protein
MPEESEGREITTTMDDGTRKKVRVVNAGLNTMLM